MPPARTLTIFVLLSLLAQPVQSEVFHEHVVVSQEAHASDAGCDVLRRGGNAIDAAVATALALAVTHPAAGNLGGGGFLVAYIARSGEIVTIDFREAAPAAATETMYLGPDGRLRPHHRAGPRAAGVPGTVRGLALAHERDGRLPWAELVRPAERLARDGFTISPTLARSLNAQLFRDADPSGVAEDLGPESDRLADVPESVRAFRKPDGTPWRAGDQLRQPDLAETLARLAEVGPDDFYRGETARRIVRHMVAGGGLIAAEDLAGYQAKVRPPIRTTFRGADVYGMGPPSSGGICVAIMLNILERFDLVADGRAHDRTVHRVAEAMRRAFAVRAESLADPDFVTIPVHRLISKPFAAELAATITDRATPSAELVSFPITDGAEGSHTTHLSTLDRDGNAVALTYTLEQGYGSKSVVAGAGFLLNNEMGDFNLIPGRTDNRGRIGTAANRIAPRKRMLSSQAPTIVVRDGKVQLVTGSPGGRTIPNTVLWVLLDRLEFGLDPTAAVAAPRTHHGWFPDVLVLEGKNWPAATRVGLEARGHRLATVATQGDAHTIIVDLAGKSIQGVADPRRLTSKASGD